MPGAGTVHHISRYDALAVNSKVKRPPTDDVIYRRNPGRLAATTGAVRKRLKRGTPKEPKPGTIEMCLSLNKGSNKNTAAYLPSAIGSTTVMVIPQFSHR